MGDYYGLLIELPRVDLNSYFIRGKNEIGKVHFAKLFVKSEDIELRIFYDDKTYFGEALVHWASKVHWEKFGSYLKVELDSENRNDRLQKVDLSDSKLFRISNSTDNHENDAKFVSVKIDSVKFYWQPEARIKNIGEFYLDDSGFRVVEPFYSLFYPENFLYNNGKFEIKRMKGSEQFYNLSKIEFRPEFNFYSKDNRGNRIAEIVKEPKIQFNYPNTITEKEALFFGDLVISIASFFYQLKIDYSVRKIFLTNQKIIIKKVENKNQRNTWGMLWGVGIHWDFNKFLLESCNETALKNAKLLSKVIGLFNQSHVVDGASTFLIRYSIIEICSKSKPDIRIWKFNLKENELNCFFENMKNSISDIIDDSEKHLFDNKWNSVLNILKSKSLRKQFEDALIENRIDPSLLPIKSNKIVQLRNNISHGSIEKVKSEELRKANVLLYRICGIFILNLMGITDWKLDTEIH